MSCRVARVPSSLSNAIQSRDEGFAAWIRKHVPEGIDGSDLEDAKAAMLAWPLIRDTEWEYVDTPEKVRVPSGRGISGSVWTSDLCVWRPVSRRCWVHEMPGPSSLCVADH